MKKILVTNDDGIDSFFLKTLVEALREKFDVTVAAPLTEQSWIGRAISRDRVVHMAEYEGYDCPAYALDGTPADCVNIALAHLFEERPAAVVSGINIGSNTGRPIILSSGTLGAAIEGAAWNVPSIACSHFLEVEEYVGIRDKQGVVEGELLLSLQNAAKRMAMFTEEMVSCWDNPHVVQNINFPKATRMDTPVEFTVPETLFVGSLFKRETHSSFRFAYPNWKFDVTEETDLACIERGHISNTHFDFSEFGAIREQCRKTAVRCE